MRLFFLGDIHGNFNIINQYINKFDIKDAHIIQVGDFGIGFNTIDKDKRMLDIYHQKLVKNNVIVWAIRGNHDYKPHFDNDPFGFSNIKLVADYTVHEIENKKILFVGGAVSIDRKLRCTKNQLRDINHQTQLGVENWWPDETFYLDTEKLSRFRDIDIVVTHTCPHYCPPDNTFGFGPLVDQMVKLTNDDDLKTDLNVERYQVAELFNILKINGNNVKLNVYGHFHNSNTINIYGTVHRMLGIGELWELNE